MSMYRIRHKLLLTLAVALSIGFATIAYFYTRAVERSIISEYQRTLHGVTDAVVMSVETIMKESHAEIMPDFARRLTKLPGVLDFRIARVDGTEAYIDNQTIDAVNVHLGEMSFPRRAAVEAAPKVFAATDPSGSSSMACKRAGSSSKFRMPSSRMRCAFLPSNCSAASLTRTTLANSSVTTTASSTP